MPFCDERLPQPHGTRGDCERYADRQPAWGPGWVRLDAPGQRKHSDSEDPEADSRKGRRTCDVTPAESVARPQRKRHARGYPNRRDDRTD